MMTPEFLSFKGDDWTLTAKIDGKKTLRDVSAGTNEVIALVSELSQSQRIMNFDDHPKNVTQLQIDFKSRRILLTAVTLTDELPCSDKSNLT